MTKEFRKAAAAVVVAVGVIGGVFGCVALAGRAADRAEQQKLQAFNSHPLEERINSVLNNEAVVVCTDKATGKQFQVFPTRREGVQNRLKEGCIITLAR